MVNKNKQQVKLLNNMIAIFVFALLLAGIVNVTYVYAKKSANNANVTVKLHTNNGNDKIEYDVEGNLFGNELWYPGKAESGVIKIENTSNQNININNLGLSVTIAAPKNTDLVYNSFANNMHFSVDKTNLIFFKDTILNNKNINDILYKNEDPDYHGSNLNNKIKVDKNSDVYLNYSLTMDSNAGKELMDLTADLKLTIGSNGDKDRSEK